MSKGIREAALSQEDKKENDWDGSYGGGSMYPYGKFKTYPYESNYDKSYDVYPYNGATPTETYKSSSYEGNDWLEPKEIKIMIAIPIKDTGKVGNPESDDFDEDTMLREAENKAMDILAVFKPGYSIEYDAIVKSEECMENVEVTITLHPQEK
jgi:hypothetical protein